jgi:hypothetical protein
MADNRTYYGEYSADHWIKLMINGDVCLPKYQRSFVWDPENVIKLMESLAETMYVPAVTLGHVKKGQSKNGQSDTVYILDGQQRLTAILLAKLGVFPDKSHWELFQDISSESIESIDEREADKEDLESAKEDAAKQGNGAGYQANSNRRVNWTFERMLNDWKRETKSMDLSFDSLKTWVYRQIKRGKKGYIPLTLPKNINVNFEETYLWFALIEPDKNLSEQKEQRLYSFTFLNMNRLGTSLSMLESRRSYYFMDARYANFFDGKTSEDKSILAGFRMKNNDTNEDIDIVRYLAILSQYTAIKADSSQNNAANQVLRNYSSLKKREQFYIDYILHILNMPQEANPKKFGSFKLQKFCSSEENSWQQRYDALALAVHGLSGLMSKKDPQKNYVFSSIAEADLVLFGLINAIVFEGKTVTIDQQLVNNLKAAVNHVKTKMSDLDKRNPNKLGLVRKRLSKSIEIYQPYVR